MHGTLKKKRKISEALFGSVCGLKLDNEKEDEMSIEQQLGELKIVVVQGFESIVTALNALQQDAPTQDVVNEKKPQSAIAQESTTSSEQSSAGSAGNEEKKLPGKPGRPAKATPVSPSSPVSADPPAGNGSVPAPTGTINTAIGTTSTIEQLQAACRDYLKASGKSEVDARADIMKVSGGKGINAIDASQYGEVIAGINALLPAVDPLFG
jgi:hypothetical protein